MSWIDRWHAGVDGLLGSARFRRWAAAFPLTRPIARRRARQMFDLVAGFVYTQVLLACVRLRVFEMLAAGPMSAEDLARRCELDVDSTVCLLDAAVSLRLLARRRGGRYALGPLGASLVGNEAVLSMIEHHSILYADLHDPVAMLRARGGGELARYWAYARSEAPSNLAASNVEQYSALMSASQPLIAEQVLDAYALGAHRCLLDVGGGDGTFLAAVARHAPQLQLMLFDLPAVAARAQARFDAAGLSARARVFGGSFLTDPLPTGADVVSLVRVLHDHDDASVLCILAAIRAVLPDDGILLIAEPMAGTAGAEAMGDAYFGFYLLAMGSGRARTAATLGQLLRRSGFDEGRLVATTLPIQTRLLIARPVSGRLRK